MKSSPTPDRARTPRALGARWRRGTTLLEVALAGVILAIVMTMVVSTVVQVASADLRGRQRIEALELANRLLLQFLDDKNAMPDSSAHIQQGMSIYRWKLLETPANLQFPEGSIYQRRDTGTTSQTAQVLDKTVLLSVTVWAGVPDGLGGYTFGEQLATLSRVHNPISMLTRNPDVLTRAAANPDQLLAMLLPLVEQAERQGGARSSSSSSSSPSSSGSPFGGARRTTNRNGDK
jgi:hypothetical protein